MFAVDKIDFVLFVTPFVARQGILEFERLAADIAGIQIVPVGAQMVFQFQSIFNCRMTHMAFEGHFRVMTHFRNVVSMCPLVPFHMAFVFETLAA